MATFRLQKIVGASPIESPFPSWGSLQGARSARFAPLPPTVGAQACLEAMPRHDTMARTLGFAMSPSGNLRELLQGCSCSFRCCVAGVGQCAPFECPPVGFASLSKGHNRRRKTTLSADLHTLALGPSIQLFEGWWGRTGKKLPVYVSAAELSPQLGKPGRRKRKRKLGSQRVAGVQPNLASSGRLDRGETSLARTSSASSSRSVSQESGSGMESPSSADQAHAASHITKVHRIHLNSVYGSGSLEALSRGREEPRHNAVSQVRVPAVVTDGGMESSGGEGGVNTGGGTVGVNMGDVCSTSLAEHREKYWKGLIDTDNWEALHLDRAGSVTDAHVLRRKGHLKEQDGLIDFIIGMHQTLSPFEVMRKMEQWVLEHMQDPKRSTLKRLIPSIGKFYTHLKLVDALREYDEFASLSRRRYVPPNFAEIRHIINIAQLHSSAEGLSLITFDADGTLYADGHHMKDDNKMIGHIVALMKRGISVAIVTAAGYPGEAARFEGRLAGLLAAFEALQLPPATTKLFHVMGGECNYLLRVDARYRLEFVDNATWMLESMLSWQEEDVAQLLDDAEAILRSASARLRVPVAIIRKERAVGICPIQPTIYEVLEEIALTVQSQLVDSKLPFCAFNGGKDVFVDIGNKSLGMAALMQYLQKKPVETLHVGDRFTVTGNDGATRSRCSVLWVANPEETSFFIRMLLRDIHLSKLTPYLE